MNSNDYKFNDSIHRGFVMLLISGILLVIILILDIIIGAKNEKAFLLMLLATFLLFINSIYMLVKKYDS